MLRPESFIAGNHIQPWHVQTLAVFKLRCSTDAGTLHSARFVFSRSLFLLFCALQAVDFDPHSLRNHLPRMVSVIEHNISEGRTVYVHCTAGLGRAPASAIAYLFWFQDMDVSTLHTSHLPL